MNVAIHTFGCRLNQFESDAMEQALEQSGYRIASADNAEIVIINSCTITEQADREARKHIAKIRRACPDANIVVTGCYASAAPAEVSALPGVSLVLGNPDKQELLAHLARLAAKTHTPQVLRPSLIAATALTRKMPFTQLPPSTSPRRARAYLKIQDGCNYACAFCIVPQVRGGSRSLPMADVITQLKSLVAAGLREIVLTGVHLGTYGFDLQPRTTLASLIAALLPHLGDSRLRLGSLDPHEVDDELIALMAENPRKLCRYLHLPVQSGDPEILRRMHRAHTAEDFRALTQTLAKRIPCVAIAADVIVGFPGESDAAFANTYDLLESSPMMHLHVFTYSKRRGTKAAAMPEQIPHKMKAARNLALTRMSQQKHQTFAEATVGQTLDCIVLRARDKTTGKLVGLSDNYLNLLFDGPDSLKSSRVQLHCHAPHLAHFIEPADLGTIDMR